MGSGQKEENKHAFSAQDAAGYLRRLADDLDSGKIQLEPKGLSREGRVSVKESLKTKEERTEVKVKLEFVTVNWPTLTINPQSPSDES
jgi:hypothetical protein